MFGTYNFNFVYSELRSKAIKLFVVYKCFTILFFMLPTSWFVVVVVVCPRKRAVYMLQKVGCFAWRTVIFVTCPIAPLYCYCLLYTVIGVVAGTFWLSNFASAVLFAPLSKNAVSGFQISCKLLSLTLKDS